MNKSIWQELCSRSAGDVCQLAVDYCIITDREHTELITAVQELALQDKNKVLVTIDHDTPNSTIEVGANQRQLINWAVKEGLSMEKCRGVGYLRYIEHYAQPGQLVVGTGTHVAGLGAAGVLGLTVTDAALLDVLKTGTLTVTVPQVLTVAIEGALAESVMTQDAALLLVQALEKAGVRGKLVLLQDSDSTLSLDQRYDLCHLMQAAGVLSAAFMDTAATADVVFSLDDVRPVTALPGALENVRALADMQGIKVNEVFLGGCRGGKLEDLRAAADVLRGQKVAYRVRLLVAPATSDIYIQALREGLIDVFLDCGAVVMNQGCSACWGKAQGTLDKGEVMVSTGSYNYAGCCGDKEASVYLVSPVSAAKAAVTGVLA